MNGKFHELIHYVLPNEIFEKNYDYDYKFKIDIGFRNLFDNLNIAVSSQLYKKDGLFSTSTTLE